MTLDDSTAARLVQVLERLEERLAQPVAPLAGERRLATLAEAQERIGCKRSKLFLLIKSGKLVRVLEGLTARITLDSIEAYEHELAHGLKRGPGRPRKTDAQREAAKIAKLKP